MGHEVRLIPPAYVKPFVKRHKNDAVDAEAICEAAQPSMRFVAVKSEEQQAAALVFRTRDLAVEQRTQLGNALRGHLAEYGWVAPQGSAHLAMLADLLEGGETGRTLPEAARPMFAMRPPPAAPRRNPRTGRQEATKCYCMHQVPSTRVRPAPSMGADPRPSPARPRSRKPSPCGHVAAGSLRMTRLRGMLAWFGRGHAGPWRGLDQSPANAAPRACTLRPRASAASRGLSRVPCSPSGPHCEPRHPRPRPVQSVDGDDLRRGLFGHHVAAAGSPASEASAHMLVVLADGDYLAPQSPLEKPITWPLSWPIWAQAVEAAADGGAKVVMLDVLLIDDRPIAEIAETVVTLERASERSLVLLAIEPSGSRALRRVHPALLALSRRDPNVRLVSVLRTRDEGPLIRIERSQFAEAADYVEGDRFDISHVIRFHALAGTGAEEPALRL